MIKLNRIGYKLGLAGAIGVLLAVGMAANQMMTEATVAGVNERAGRSQRVADSCARGASRPAQDAAHRPRHQVGEDAGRGRKERRRAAAVQAVRSQGNRCRAGDRPEAGDQGTAAEDQVADGRVSPPASKNLRRRKPRCWRRSTSARRSRANGPRRSRRELASPALAKLDNRAEIEKLLHQADAKVNSLRAAGLAAGRHRRRQPDRRRWPRPRPRSKDVFNQLRGEADDRDCWP